MATAVTATVERWEVEVLAECSVCTELMTVAPVLHGIELDGRFVCDGCYFYRFDGSKTQVLTHLGLVPENSAA